MKKKYKCGGRGPHKIKQGERVSRKKYGSRVQRVQLGQRDFFLFFFLSLHFRVHGDTPLLFFNERH